MKLWLHSKIDTIDLYIWEVELERIRISECGISYANSTKNEREALKELMNNENIIEATYK